MAQGKKAEAEELCQAGEARSAGQPRCLPNAGRFLCTPIGDLDKAIAEYASLYSDHPKDVQVAKNYVQLLILKNRLDEANSGERGSC